MVDVSIIVPVYNTEEHLQKCLDSLTRDVINFLKKQNAEVRDKDFWYVDTKSSIYLFGIIPIFKLRKSTKTSIGYLFGFVPVYVNGGKR